MYKSLVLEGGGVKGIAYLGAIKYLEELNILNDIKNFAGSSAGSQAASLLAVGYSSDELTSVFNDMPLDDFKDGNCGCCRDLYRLFNHFGYYKGEFLERYFDTLISVKLKKANATFLELYNNQYVHLKITGTCLEKQKLVVFDYINSPNMPICIAIHISSCIPFFYKPVKYNNLTYVDGGCLRNFPLNIFNDKPGKTIGIELINDDDLKTEWKINSIKDFIFSLMCTIHTAANALEVNPNKIHLIRINTKETSAIDFNLSDEEKQELIDTGYFATQESFVSL